MKFIANISMCDADVLRAAGAGGGGGGVRHHRGAGLDRVPAGVVVDVPLQLRRHARVPREQAVHRADRRDLGDGRGHEHDRVPHLRAQDADPPPGALRQGGDVARRAQRQPVRARRRREPVAGRLRDRAAPVGGARVDASTSASRSCAASPPAATSSTTASSTTSRRSRWSRCRREPIPVLIGGHSDVQLRRAARLGDGWMGAGGMLDDLIPMIDRMNDLRKEYGRDERAVRHLRHHPGVVHRRRHQAARGPRRHAHRGRVRSFQPLRPRDRPRVAAGEDRQPQAPRRRGHQQGP